VGSTYELTAEEQFSVWSLVAEVRERLLTELKPDAFSIVVNDAHGAQRAV
jgi:diadenosine tetraphosphate (Ap4A) HIT family hydrolase